MAPSGGARRSDRDLPGDDLSGPARPRPGAHRCGHAGERGRDCAAPDPLDQRPDRGTASLDDPGLVRTTVAGKCCPAPPYAPGSPVSTGTSRAWCNSCSTLSRRSRSARSGSFPSSSAGDSVAISSPWAPGSPGMSWGSTGCGCTRRHSITRMRYPTIATVDSDRSGLSTGPGRYLPRTARPTVRRTCLDLGWRPSSRVGRYRLPRGIEVGHPGTARWLNLMR